MIEVFYKLVPIKEAGKKLQLNILYSKADEFPNDGGVKYADRLAFNHTLLKFLGTEDIFKVIGDPTTDEHFAVVIREYDIKDTEFDLNDLFDISGVKYTQDDFKSWNTDETH